MGVKQFEICTGNTIPDNPGYEIDRGITGEFENRTSPSPPGNVQPRLVPVSESITPSPKNPYHPGLEVNIDNVIH